MQRDVQAAFIYYFELALVCLSVITRTSLENERRGDIVAFRQSRVIEHVCSLTKAIYRNLRCLKRQHKRVLQLNSSRKQPKFNFAVYKKLTLLRFEARGLHENVI